MNKTIAKCCFLLLISLLFVNKIQAQSATISNVRSEHNVSQNGMNGMRIHIHFSVDGMKGDNVRAIAFFYDENKQPLKTTYSNYQTTSGDVCTYKDYRNIPYNSAEWKDFTLFIPYKAMDFTAGKHTYYFRVHIRPNNKSSAMAKSQYYAFSATGSNTKIVRNADGSVIETTKNADGTTTTVTTSICSFCRGNGKCTTCGGQGGLWGGFGEYRRYVICKVCGGGTLCTYCAGRGKTVLQFVYDPSTNSSVMTNMNTGQKFYSGPSLNNGISGGFNDLGGSNFDNSNNRNKANTGKTTCTYCNGTGKDPSPKYGPDYGGATTYRYCSICGKTSQSHYHDVCPGCRGLGYY